jgi:hypothetical protein
LLKKTKKNGKLHTVHGYETCLSDYLNLYWILKYFFPRELIYLILNKNIWALIPFENNGIIGYYPVEELIVKVNIQNKLINE